MVVASTEITRHRRIGGSVKKLVEVDTGSLESLMGERVTFYCTRYIYCGKLIGITDSYAVLEDAVFVYETGPFDTKDWKTAHKLPNKEWQVMLHAVECFGILKK